MKRWQRLSEIVDGVLVIGAVFLVWVFFLYFNAFWIELKFLFGSPVTSLDREVVVFEAKSSEDGAEMYEELLSTDHKVVKSALHTYELESYLDSSLWHYSLPFTTLPPGRRLLVNTDEVVINVPIVDVPYASLEKLENADFDAELKSGVVKYPTTPSPVEKWGTTLLFWHSSVATYQSFNNPYGFAFYHLPKLVAGNTVEVWRDGIAYTYEVTHKNITAPDKVSDHIKPSNEKGTRWIVLMACYPLFSTANRILIHGEQTETSRDMYTYVWNSLKRDVWVEGQLAFTSYK